MATIAGLIARFENQEQKKPLIPKQDGKPVLIGAGKSVSELSKKFGGQQENQPRNNVKTSSTSTLPGKPLGREVGTPSLELIEYLREYLRKTETTTNNIIADLNTTCAEVTKNLSYPHTIKTDHEQLVKRVDPTNKIPTIPRRLTSQEITKLGLEEQKNSRIVNLRNRYIQSLKNQAATKQELLRRIQENNLNSVLYTLLTPEDRKVYNNLHPEDQANYLNLSPEDRKLCNPLSPVQQEVFLSPEKRAIYQALSPEERKAYLNLTREQRDIYKLTEGPKNIEGVADELQHKLITHKVAKWQETRRRNNKRW